MIEYLLLLIPKKVKATRCKTSSPLPNQFVLIRDSPFQPGQTVFQREPFLKLFETRLLEFLPLHVHRCGEDISIRELAELICEVVGFKGDLAWDTTKPDGTPRKLLDVSKIHALGWRHRIGFRDGIARTYQWFLENEK